jgi:hypothetical protein
MAACDTSATWPTIALVVSPCANARDTMKSSNEPAKASLNKMFEMILGFNAFFSNCEMP